jgi:hypothetical protein
VVGGVGEGVVAAERRGGHVGAPGRAERDGVAGGFDAVEVQLAELGDVVEDAAERALEVAGLGVVEGEPR